MAVCANCGRETEGASYYRGKYYCEDCYREVRSATQLAS
jgi:NMD protein affecting ribosome stability and mRNA decay